jgi:hypothetical protein
MAKQTGFRITGGVVEGTIIDQSDSVAINIVAAIAEKLGLDPVLSGVIFKRKKDGTEADHKAPVVTKKPGTFKPVPVGK